MYEGEGFVGENRWVRGKFQNEKKKLDGGQREKKKSSKTKTEISAEKGKENKVIIT
jgi:hypothetical protein